MKNPAVLMIAVLSASWHAAPAHGQILETAGIYSKAGAFGAGLGAAVSASMKQLGSTLTPLTPQQRTEAEQTSKVLINAAQQEEKQGRKPQAMQAYRNLGLWRQKVFGEKDKQAQAAYLKAGDLAMSQKDYPQSENNYRQALSGAVKCYGPGTADLIPFLNKLIAVTSAQKNFHDADSFASQVVALSEREYGANDPRAKAAKQQLYAVLQGYGEQLTRDNRTAELQAVQQRMATLEPASTPPAAATNTVQPTAPPTAEPSVPAAGSAVSSPAPATTSGDNPPATPSSP